MILVLYYSHSKNATRLPIQIGGQKQSGNGVGGQHSGRFNGGNAQDQTNFGRHPVAFLGWP